MILRITISTPSGTSAANSRSAKLPTTAARADSHTMRNSGGTLCNARSRSLHLTPVCARGVTHAEQYQWSSTQAYVGTRIDAWLTPRRIDVEGCGEVSAVRQLRSRPTLDQVISAVSTATAVESATIRKPGGQSAARAVAIALVYKTCGLSQKRDRRSLPAATAEAGVRSQALRGQQGRRRPRARSDTRSTARAAAEEADLAAPEPCAGQALIALPR